MFRNDDIALTTLVLATGLSTACAQTLLFKDDFSDPKLTGWTDFGFGTDGVKTNVNQQLVISARCGPLQTNSAAFGTHYPFLHSIQTGGPLPDNGTLEWRADLVSANQNDAWASVTFLWDGLGAGYVFNKDQDEVALVKFLNGGQTMAWFFYEQRPLKNENVTSVLALTRRGANLEINTRVLDKANANAVLYERTMVDTPLADPVLPNRSVRGMLSGNDVAGKPYALMSGPNYVEVELNWANPEHAPDGAAQLVFDNGELWQYESPRLSIQKTIQNAVVLSWPLTQSPFVLENASSVTGPWAPVLDPSWHTNAGQNQVSLLTPESLNFFRLRQGP